MNCSENGCTRPAEWCPRICIPALGWPIHEHEPMSLVLAAPVCEAHFPGVDLQATLAPGLIDGKPGIRRLVEVITRGAGRVAPDFDRAYIERAALDAPDVQAALTDNGRGPLQ